MTICHGVVRALNHIFQLAQALRFNYCSRNFYNSNKEIFCSNDLINVYSLNCGFQLAMYKCVQYWICVYNYIFMRVYVEYA